MAQRTSDQTTKGGLQHFARLPEDDWCAAANDSMQSNTEVHLVEAAVVDPVDHVFDCSEIAISSGLSIGREAERSDLQWFARCGRRGLQHRRPVLYRG